MATRRRRKLVPEGPMEVVAPVFTGPFPKEPEPVPEEPPAPVDKVEGHYPFQLIARYESADGREIRKLEASEKDRDPLVLLKSSTRFLDAEGNVVACSEALTTIKGTIGGLKAGRW